jgi:hypothetical protein
LGHVYDAGLYRAPTVNGCLQRLVRLLEARFYKSLIYMEKANDREWHTTCNIDGTPVKAGNIKVSEMENE